MNKDIICVYQDCPLCGDRGKKILEKAEAKGITIHKVSFASPEGKELIRIGVFEKGIRKMPFFTDGVKFAHTIDELEEKPKKVTKKKRKTTKKVKKGGEDENLG